MVTDEGKADGLVAVSIFLCTIATFAVVARSIIRCFVLRHFWWDDGTIVAAVVFTLGYLAEILFLRSNGLGVSASSELTAENMVNFLKATLAVEVTYYVAVGFIKTSILLLYLRFAVSETFRKLCYGTIVFEAVFSLICIIVVLAQCTPLNKVWDVMHMVQGTCINTTAFFFTTSAINIITDIWIIGLPVKALRGMNCPRRELVALFILFGAGILAIIMSIVRLQGIYMYTLSTVPFHDAIPVNMWSMIEMNVAILCASVPALKLLMSPLRLRQVMHEKRHRYRPESSSDRPYFSDQEHNSFVKERMTNLPPNLIAVQTTSLTEVTTAVLTGANNGKTSRSLTPASRGGGELPSYDDKDEEEYRLYGLDFLRNPRYQSSVKSFCYAGELPGQKD